MFSIPNAHLKELLMEEKLMDESSFDALVAEAERLTQSVTDMMISRGILTREYLGVLLSRYFKVSLASLGGKKIDATALKLIPESVARERRVVLFAREEDGSIAAAMEDPSNLALVEYLERSVGSKVRPYLAFENDLNKGFAMYGLELSADFEKLIEKNIRESLQSGRRGEDAAAEVPIVAIVDNIVAYAHSSRASDIHLEVFEDFVLIRYRIDGVLHEIVRMQKEVHAAIVARIKLIAGLKIDEHYKPQDGRFRVKIGTDNLDMRVSILPTYYGEKVVMRLLAAASRPLSLSELGVFEDMEAIILENIKKSYGIVIICGPTGSGKSTTLYSMLSVLNRPEVNIVTVEDPVEYDIKYVNQTQINPQAGISFASGLRAILRQDPNVILVGEIRDGETASISVQSALTGHLVLSSLHTNDATTTIPRLIDMGVQPFLLAAVMNAVIAQRLVRRICTQCIYSFEPTAEMKAAIEAQLKELGIDSSVPTRVYAGKGCPACGNTGYRGRLGIYEILDINESIKKLIVAPTFELAALKERARKNGMLSIFEDGLRKVAAGLTTVEELLRAVRE